MPTASRPGSGSLRPLLEAGSGPVHTGTWPASHGALRARNLPGCFRLPWAAPESASGFNVAPAEWSKTQNGVFSYWIKQKAGKQPALKVGVRKSDFGGAERFPKHLVSFIPAGGFRARSYGGTPQLCCYLLHFRPSPIRGGPNPCALPIESAYGPFGGFGEGQENLGGNGADDLPAWFRLPSASPGGGFGSCSHRDVACEPRRTAD